MSHRKIFFVLLLAGMACLAEAADLVKKPSQKGVQETMDKLEAVVRDKGLTVFNRIDHQANARKAGLEQPAAQVLIFGNPKIGTAIMTQDPAAGLDLPLRVLVYQDKEGKTWISYHDPQALKQSYGVAGVPAVDKVTKALMGITDAAAK